MCIFSNVVRIQKVCPILPWKIYSPIVFIIGCCQHIAKYDLMYFFCPWCRIHDWNQNKPRENLIPCLFFHQKEAFLLGQEQRNDTKIQNTNFGLCFMEVLWIRQHCRLSICEYWLSWTVSEQKMQITFLILKQGLCRIKPPTLTTWTS